MPEPTGSPSLPAAVALSEDFVRRTCKFGQGRRCCSFLVAHPQLGWDCTKAAGYEQARAVIERRRAAKQMNAMSDNCSGPPDFVEVV